MWRIPLIIYAAIALVLIWSGAGWVITDVGNWGNDPNGPISERPNQFILLHGISMILIGTYIVCKNLVFRSTRWAHVA